MPGFNDAHTHIADAGLQRLTANLDGVTSLAEMQSRIAAYAKTLDDPHAWILGGGWDHTKWPTKTLPTRQDLDAVTGSRPAFLDRVDGHIAVANTAALKAAGIDATTPDPSAATSTATRKANPPASSAKLPPALSSKNTSHHPATTPAAKPSSSPSRTRSPTASPPSRTSPPGRLAHPRRP